MLIAYFDEVKYEPKRSPHYWLGAIIADATTIWSLERKVNDLAQDVFGQRVLDKSTEFHASALFCGRDHFKGWELSHRVEVLKRLCTIFASEHSLTKIFVQMDPQRMVSSDVDGMAFMFLVERLDDHLGNRNSPGMLIGDRESETIAVKFAESLSHYRTWGTKFPYGKELRYLLDTVHFTHSHQSRMLQLADLHVWLRHLVAAGDDGKWHRKAILEHLRTLGDPLVAAKLKIWPTEASWIKV